MFSYCAPPPSWPAPRRTARSMLSFGTELFFAFWMASYSVGFPAGSPPPVLAATSTFLISLANSLPRLASTTAFLCFVVAHLEWPLIDYPFTMSTKSSWMRRSGVSSGWKAVARSCPWRTATILPVRCSVPRISTFSPTCSTQGARMNTARSGAASAPSPVSSMSCSNESTCRPNAFLRTVMSMPPNVCWPATPSASRSASMIIPAHDPNAGSPSAISLRTGSSISKATESRHSVVDSPPGMIRPSTRSSSGGRRTGTAVAPASASARRCSGTSPCKARTPTTGRFIPWLPATPGVVLVRGQGVQVDADHGLAEAAGDLGHDVGIVVERGGLHDRGGALGRVARLEDPGAHEYALRAELHHQRGVRGGRDAARGEQHHREPPQLRDLGDQLVRRGEFLGRGEQLLGRQAGQPRDLRPDRPHVPGRFYDVAGPGLALRPDHGRALGDPAQRLPQVGGAADERHGELPLVDVMLLVGRGEHLGLVDVVDPDRLQDLRLGEVPDPALGHDRDGDRGDDAVDHVWVAHPGHAALGADVGGHALQRHHRDRAGVLRDLGLVGRDDVHDHAALEHLRHTALHARGPGDRLGVDSGHWRTSLGNSGASDLAFRVVTIVWPPGPMSPRRGSHGVQPDREPRLGSPSTASRESSISKNSGALARPASRSVRASGRRLASRVAPARSL